MIGGSTDERVAGFRAKVRRDWDDARDVGGALRVDVAGVPRGCRGGGGGLRDGLGSEHSGDRQKQESDTAKRDGHEAWLPK